MLLNKFIKQVNKLVGNSSSFALTYDQLEQYINTAVDTINLELKTTMLSPEEDWSFHQTYYSIIYSKQFLGSLNYIDSSQVVRLGDMYYNLLEEDYYIYTTEGWQKIFANEFDTGALVPRINIKDSLYDYKCMPEYIIRSVLCYLTAALYLEEEDELENQYRTYMSKVEENLIRVKHTYYSSYDTCHEEPNEHQDSNPYWIGDGE